MDAVGHCVFMLMDAVCHCVFMLLFPLKQTEQAHNGISRRPITSLAVGGKNQSWTVDHNAFF